MLLGPQSWHSALFYKLIYKLWWSEGVLCKATYQSGQNKKGQCRRQSLNRNIESLLGELLVGAKENVPWSPGGNGFALFLPSPTPRTLLVPQLLPGQWPKRGKCRWNVNFKAVLGVVRQREWSGPSLPDGTAHGHNWALPGQGRIWHAPWKW